MIAVESWGFALVHFLWQGVLVAGGLFAALRASQGARPELRYALGLTALLVMAALPAITLHSLERRGSTTAAAFEYGRSQSLAASDLHAPQAADGAPRTRANARRGVAGTSDADPPGAAPIDRFRLPLRVQAALRPFLEWIVAAWAIGVLALSIRLLGGWVRLRRLTGLDGPAVPDAVRATARDLAARLAVSRPVRLVRSARVGVPAVVGWVRPVILLPASALTGLAPAQLEAILAHELAHIRRHDYLVNLFQTVIETLFFYHPAVWWVSHRVREEREHCCDDLAVAVCGDRRLYAGALVALEAIRSRRSRVAMAADGTSLVPRVRRLRDRGSHGGARVPRCSAALSAATVAIAMVMACGGDSLLSPRSGTMDATAGPDRASGDRAMLFIGEAFADKVFRYEVTAEGRAVLDREIVTNVTQPGGIAFSPWGEMFVSNRTGSVARFLDPVGSATPNGRITAGDTGAPFGQPHWLTFRAGELFIAQQSGSVLRFTFDADGHAVFDGTLTTGPGARGIRSNPTTGELLVSRLEDAIHRFAFDATGAAVSGGTIPGGGTNLHGMAFTPWGELLVVDYFGDRISRFTFDPSGDPVPNGVITGGDLSGPIDLDFSPWGELFVTNHNQVPGRVTRWTFSSDDASAVALFNGSFEVRGNLGGIRFAAP